ncbi:bifunctional phosphopantothenoylcysteine decarboxylase/phosphopantothenate--cysteine ligase CoaBC [Thiohalocapsa marina]|uniref:Coenzyme A biosynthesis bifunctional protein CoaBC n=1 Tax=Thiohalocapsa marina TaxID=424902 RepID=A0A5M8FLE5_9GAMM|nr:bifunctional phosphopantothenoylcysteine decarboxylase/phosphopantothenate--cysteine ligase CoaBC [Thiohalocapsa marina]KAA6185314.1 bifunctional phosphopantothenoylcysteine decarboxylase/phosphopantothenate--cysteine ligase CoaBC [Thiohalocapsa marina]
MSASSPRKILLGISGGIAAYKTPELVRRLRERGAEVQVVMTRAAGAFVTPLSLQAVSGRPVRTELLDPAAEAGMDHIELARWPDAILLAPATAHLIARLAHGLADDLLTTLALAADVPLWLAPAMNQGMWRHPATAANAALLAARGCVLLGPDDGPQACGDIGPGRMLAPEDIVARLCAPAAGPLQGRRVLMTAGPTREAIDPVRFIGNRSSGKMGYALAAALGGLGAEVILVSGPTALACPSGVERIAVESAAQMHAAVMARASDCHIFVAAAAVADYRVERPAVAKIKKQAETLTLGLVRNPDILADVAALPQPPFTVGFAAETHDLEAHATAKLERKRLDMIAANHVGDGAGFEVDDNALLVFWRGGQQRLPTMPKASLGVALAQLIGARYAASLAG